MAGPTEQPIGPGIVPPPTLEQVLGKFSNQPWFWQLLVLMVGGGLIGALTAPAQAELQQLGFSAFPDVALTSPDLATAVVRGFMDMQTATAEARKTGTNAERFATMVQLAGEALAPFQAAEALRRGVIAEKQQGPNDTSFEAAIREGNLADKWAPVIQALAVQWPTPTDALQALLQGQVDEPTARALYQRFGGDPDYFTLLFNTRGSAPTPLEASRMAMRGIIPWSGSGPGVVSFQQAFLEGPWRDKWSVPYQKLAAYYPPPRTVTAMLKQGALTVAQATQYLEQQGLSQDLTAAYVKAATGEKLVATKHLALGTIETLYLDKLIDGKTATTMIEELGYTAEDAGFILSVQDLKFAQRQMTSAVSKVRSLYVAHKITRTAALHALNELQLPPANVSDLLNTWDLERADNAHLPTPSQIESAWEYKIIGTDQALQLLQQLGYSPHDAWLVLSVKNKGPLPGEPPAEVGPNGPEV